MLKGMAGKNEGDAILETIYSSIDYIYDDNTMYYAKDITRKELEDFILQNF
jgi:hypothetical protein